ncbi:MAG: 50S ribosomal protein L3 [Cytophagales bacterium]|nr:50S ribosomal protein L3 [Armatimonadota bacterium]
MSVKGILGKKVGMTQIFDDAGRVVPVTVLSVSPNVVTQVKTLERDGYSAAQLGFEDIKVEKLTRPQQGHLYHAGIQPKRFLREFDLQDGATVAIGDEFKADLFAVGEKIQISGTSKGKGFAGVMKRYGFRGGEMTHGSMIHRKPMSAGATDAARVFKGTKRPGRMGNERVTQQGLKVVQVDTERNLLLVRGAVPGANGGLVMIHKAHI